MRWHARRRRWRLTPGLAEDGFLTPPPRPAGPVESAGPRTVLVPVTEPVEREPGAGREPCPARLSLSGTIVEVSGKPVELGDLLAMWPEVRTVARTDGNDSEELSRLLFPDRSPVKAAGRP